MKTFKQFLTESTKEHKLTIRFGAELDEGSENCIERFLGKYDLKVMSKTSTTPITKSPMFFEDDVENVKVSKIDITTGYPLSADILRQQLSDLLMMPLTHVAVHPEGWEPTEEEEKEEGKAVLGTEYGDESDNGKHYGKTFVDKFLDELTPSENEKVENVLSLTPAQDKAQEVMSKDDQSSDSVISGKNEIPDPMEIKK